ncbi:molecular chaperone TorD family protein [Evansella sp. AB-P1]|uniref:TorD/DmsD family molecular chaperone n=1 Tax=Evansella sp. AB-P1 TaxID=3037653 RepID=UPI00241E2EEF|nr:molecular chaperone TorD family protein [Evansella sp. AB-P1]MDG5786092.1 molecular chaperone TorD family protein [Evansella sp. AB-P1]
MEKSLGTLQYKANLFKILSEFYNKPKDDMQSLYAPLNDSLVALYPDLVTYGKELESEFLELHGDITPLSVEYAKLFIGPFDVLAPPYSSIYLDSGHQILGESTKYVEKLYRNAGLEISDSFKDLPDHIAAELEFIYYNYFSYIDTNEVQFLLNIETFLESHLSLWVAKLNDQIWKRANLEFYKTLTLLTTKVVVHELNEFKGNVTIH